MAGSQELHLVYKNLGETPLQAILRYKNENPIYMEIDFTYAGRLDPMAEGLLVLLSGENLKKKDDFLNLDKTYEVEILWGFTTDTGDLLGKILESDSEATVSKELVENYINNSRGKIEQSYPAFSSKPVSGKPLHVWAREGKLEEIVMPTHIVEIFSANYIERREISANELLNQIESKIAKVTGDFRQEEILKLWKESLQNTNNNYFIDKFVIKSSSGFYVRQFVLDLGKKFNILSTTFSIKRIQIGEYKI